jgi:hypothetical protein
MMGGRKGMPDTDNDEVQDSLSGEKLADAILKVLLRA